MIDGCQPPPTSRTASPPGRTSSSPSTRPAPTRRGARVEEADSPLRTPFQRDRDRIVHSKSFRRLKHKTQVFVAPEGDHYRTRLTHTLEACGIARTVARALGLNEDLTEAIGLGHDLGHPPFGHAGEDALDAALRERCGSGFRHNEHSLRVVEVLERDGAGPEPDRAGPRRHPQPQRRRPSRRRWRAGSSSWSTASPTSTTTSTTPCGPGSCGQEDLPAAEIELLGPTGSLRIDTLVRDIVERSDGAGDIVQGEEIGGAMLRLRKFMFDRVYLGPDAQREHERVERTMRGLFDHYLEHPDELPALGPRGERQPARHRLHRRHDRPLLHRQVHRADGPRGGPLLVALISPESLDRVKQAADIVEVISAHTDLRRAGARYTGLCPFHDERTPSFSVDAQEKLYHCFGCGVGGDVIKFVEEKDGLGLRRGGGAAGRPLRGRDRARAGGPAGGGPAPAAPPPRAAAGPRRRLLRQLPLGGAGGGEGARVPGRARARRGGAARASASATRPAPGTRSSSAASRPASASRSCTASASSSATATAREYDRFRSRIMFPIRDRRGRVLGFGGRAMRSDQGAKYVNTAETDFFHKSQLLYGVDKAKAAIAKANRAVVVEGYTDVLALHQAGVEETVAVMGTAITGEQVATLSGMVEEVVLALDADSAGQEAMLRAQRVAAGRKMRLRVATMPAGEDPAEMMAAPGGPERFRALIDAAVELNAFQVGLVLDRTDVASPVERDRALDEVAPVLAAMGETASRDDLVRQVAERLDLEPAMVMGRVVAAQPLSGGASRSRPARAPAAAAAGAGAAATPRRRADLARAPRAGAAGDVHRPAGGGQGVPRRASPTPTSRRPACAPPPGCASTPRTRPPTSPTTPS